MLIRHYSLQKISLLVGLLFLTACQPNSTETEVVQHNSEKPTPAYSESKNIAISKKKWGEVNGEPVWLFTLKNQQGMKVKVTNWGAYTQSIIVPNKHGKFEDVILGYDNFADYQTDCCFNGGTIGRYANRIKHGKFTLNGQQYQLTTNNGGPNKINHLHGGKTGFHQRLWQAEVIGNSVKMTYLSPEGEQGYPGNLTAHVTYQLNNNNEFSMAYEATTDKATPINLISHVYFNLTGTMVENIEHHQLMINADQTTEVEAMLTPTGKFNRVDNTPFDFRQLKSISQDIRTHNPQLKLAGGLDSEFGGYDHNWVLNQYDGTLKHQITLFEPKSGRELNISTTQPGVQVYTTNFFNGSVTGKQGKKLTNRLGVALETQHFPDSPNQENFPNTILQPDQRYSETTVYQFNVK